MPEVAQLAERVKYLRTLVPANVFEVCVALAYLTVTSSKKAHRQELVPGSILKSA
jgi:hypothetical protein